jgi:hypothetical protein
MSKAFPEGAISMASELRLLLALSTPPDAGNKALAELLREPIDWPEFLKLSLWHGLYPLVYANLKSMGDTLPHAIPATVMTALQMHFRQNAIRMTGLCGELARLTGVLEGANVRVLPWKGPVAALQIYGDISFRTSCDIDLLVAPGDIFAAIGVLIAAGYEVATFSNALTHAQLRRIVQHGNHFPPLYNAGRGITVEVHWRVSSLIASSELDFELLWLHSVSITWNGFTFRALSREAAFLTMAVHGAKHGWGQLRWLRDVASLLESEDPLDGKWLCAEAARLRINEIIFQTLILTQLFFKVPIPEWADEAHVRNKKALELSRMAAVFMTSPSETAAMVLFPKTGRSMSIYNSLYWAAKRYDFALCNTFSRKLSCVLLFFAPKAEVFEYVNLPDKLHFLYHPLRIVLWLRRRILNGL